MANQNIIAKKKEVVEEITNKVKEAASTVLFEYQGLTVTETMELRRKLRESGSDYKVYKNTLTKRALSDSGIELNEYLEGPTAISFSNDELAPVRILNNFAKDHEALELKAGIVEGKVATTKELKKYAAIPSRDTLLTMLATGMIAKVRDLSICLDLYAKQKEE